MDRSIIHEISPMMGKGCSPSEFRENYHKTRVIV